jgi:hypothetical protein
MPEAKWDAAYCAAKGAADELCYPRVDPFVGITHAADGRRLLTNQGLELPPGYQDPNVMPPRDGG